MAPESPTWTAKWGLCVSLHLCLPVCPRPARLSCSVCAWCVCIFVSVPGHVTSLGGGLDLAYLRVRVCVCVCVSVHAFMPGLHP